MGEYFSLHCKTPQQMIFITSDFPAISSTVNMTLFLCV